MSRLDELITELCPNGVEYRRLGTICSVLRGKRLTKKDLKETDPFPVYHGGLEPLGFYSKSNRDSDTVMIINVGASAGTVGYCKDEFWSSDGCFCLSKSAIVLPKFIYYYLTTKEQFLMSKVRKAGIPTLDALVVENLCVPVPPLEVQCEIVRLLDHLSLLTEELTEKLEAEMKARKKQYECYRDNLMTFKES